jgi:hypothetical protein
MICLNKKEKIHDASAQRKETTMKIELSTREYRDLLDILHIADVVMSGHRRDEDTRTERHRALIQKLFAFAQGEGLERLFSHDAITKKYIPTAEFEENTLAHTLIDEFGDHLFWDELISRLSVRDAAQMTGGLDRLNAMSDTDRQYLEGPIRQRYIEEFSANGIANVEVVERSGTGWGTPSRTSD